MANLLLRHVYKIYPGVGKPKKNAKGEAKKRSGDFVAVKDFNMEINDGEFIVFVGPSGCGKSTTLRMIAGLEEISGGELYIDDQLVNDVDAKDRDIAMVFQSYALYPHLTAYDNIAFGLKMRKVPVPRLDSQGKQMVGIDTQKINSLTKRVNKLRKNHASMLKDLDKCKNADAVLQTKIDDLAKQVAAATDDQQEKLNEKLENARSEKQRTENDLLYYSEKGALLEKRIADGEKDLQYYKETPVPLFKYVHMKKSEIDEKVQWAAKILGIDLMENLISTDRLILQTASTWSEAYPVERGVVIHSLGEFTTETELFTIKPGEMKMIELYCWLEGQDVDCTNQIQGAQIMASIQFSTKPDEQSGLIPIYD